MSLKYHPSVNPEECKRLLETNPRLLTNIERQCRTILASHMSPMACPMCFEGVSVYDAAPSPSSGDMSVLYTGPYVCPKCSTELAKVVPMMIQPGSPGWHWRRKHPVKP